MIADKRRVTITIQYPIWKKLQALQLDKEIWGLSAAIEFLIKEYENHYPIPSILKPLTEKQKKVITRGVKAEQ